MQASTKRKDKEEEGEGRMFWGIWPDSIRLYADKRVTEEPQGAKNVK